MSSLQNRDSGLVRLAVKQGHISDEQVEQLTKAIEAGYSARDALLQAGLTDETILDLQNTQNANSIPAEFDGYKVTGIVGKGGMSVVLKADHMSTGQPVAIKVLSPAISDLPTSKERFHREIRSVAKVVHPHVIRCFGSGETNDRPYLALEYMGKGDVRTMMKKSGGSVPEQQALRIALECAEGLEAVEAAGMMHRDIKPENIFLADDGTAKIADLGLSKESDDEEGLTMVGKSVGTPAYMSPEQALGRYDVNIRTDLFSLGATLYHMVTGQQPFKADNPRLLMRAVVQQQPTMPSEINQSLMPGTEAIILGLLAKKPDDRYQRPADLIADLKRLGRDGRRFDPTTLSTPAAKLAQIKTEAIRNKASNQGTKAYQASGNSGNDMETRFVVAKPIWRQILEVFLPFLKKK